MTAAPAKPDAPESDAAARGRAMYDLESTPVIACKHDPRFSYCLYVPPTLGQGEEPSLVVTMHGTGRGFVGYRDGFAEFARWNNCIILAPLFPIGVRGDGNRDGFKYMREGDIRYDLVLIKMIEEVVAHYGLKSDKFALFGYSGGGHFAHRFLMFHPQRLWAASIGAPGSVTLLDPTRDFWVGTRNVKELFGLEIDTAAMAKVPVQMIVGAADLETWEITHKEGGRNWMPDANHAGKNRPERLAALKKSFEEHGIAVRFDLVPNMPHDGPKALSRVQDFLADVLRKRRTGAARAA